MRAALVQSEYLVRSHGLTQARRGWRVAQGVVLATIAESGCIKDLRVAKVCRRSPSFRRIEALANGGSSASQLA